MSIVFNVNGSNVAQAALGRVGQFTGTDPKIAELYAAFSELNGKISVVRLTMAGTAVTTTVRLDKTDGGALDQSILVGAQGSDPAVSLNYSNGWTWSEVVATRRLTEAVLALAKTTRIGTLTLEVT